MSASPTATATAITEPGHELALAEKLAAGSEHVELSHRLDDKDKDKDISSLGHDTDADADTNLTTPTTHRETRLVRRVDLRVLPVLAIIFAVSIIDRINVGSARVLGMQQDLDLTGNRYNVILQTFFPAYLLAELPSNYVLAQAQLSPRAWLSFLLVSWGAVLTGMGFTSSWRVLAFLRFLLGLFEGGILPGMVFIISCWYCRYEVHRRVSWAYSVGVLASAFAGVLAYALGLMGGLRDMKGWRWIFALEGAATMLIGIVSWFAIPHFPQHSNVLSADDKELYTARLQRDHGHGQANGEDKITWSLLGEVLGDWTNWLQILLFTFTNTSTYSLAFFVPTILTGMGYTGLHASLYSAWPYLATMGAMWIFAYVSDKTRMRTPVICVQSLLLLIGLLLIRPRYSNQLRYFGVFLATIGCQCNVPAQLALAQSNAPGSAKRSIMAAVVAWGGPIGGLVGSNIFRQQDAPTYVPGLYTTVAMAVMIIVGNVLVALVFHRRNRIAEQTNTPVHGVPDFKHSL
ncbi:hypothetical protein A1O3_07226 [Capronia epimyces CBS 606.96]|uniref:Major facilitator superfamily (MFS) profile domain-containing protein n=1 Tax=Capronia epimyces CBS 606.96 TaxID=1182542 RepID=W9XL78_9EURO|nr:uncharacterized protein A1O3_07226 [Capronia epimyces CBS 606.96]EXJ80938.1 hypothetical protein A1O3_07226 [Capronia epimyces CBS 606.96]